MSSVNFAIRKKRKVFLKYCGVMHTNAVFLLTWLILLLILQVKTITQFLISNHIVKGGGLSRKNWMEWNFLSPSYWNTSGGRKTKEMATETLYTKVKMCSVFSFNFILDCSSIIVTNILYKNTFNDKIFMISTLCQPTQILKLSTDIENGYRCDSKTKSNDILLLSIFIWWMSILLTIYEMYFCVNMILLA